MLSKSRFAYVAIVIGVISLLWLQLVLLVIKNGATAQQQALLTNKSITEASPSRGIFYDRNGVKLTNNTSSYKLVLKTDDRALRQEVSQILSRAELESIESFVKTPGGFQSKSYLTSAEKILLATNLTSEQLDQIKLEESVLRSYPYLEVAHVIGYVGKVNEADLALGYKSGDLVGKFGLELLLENKLKGLSQQSLPGLAEESLAGQDVVLTIDIVWQKMLSSVLATEVERNQALGGAAIIINKNNGEVVASVNSPTFNPNLFVLGIADKDYQQLLNDPRAPLVDKVFNWQASPGSTIKPLVTFSLLKNNTINPETRYYSAGCMALGSGKFCEIDSKRLGSLKLHDAIVRSSNIYFCNAAIKLSQEKGIETLISDLSELGLGEKTSWASGSATGVVGGPAYKQQFYKQGWFDGDTCNTSIGQGFVLVSPSQLAFALAALTNGGNLYAPRVVRSVGTEGQGSSIVRKISIDGADKSFIESAMQQVVYNYRGSAYSLSKLPRNLNLKAKTGSAEVSEYVNGTQKVGTHSWVVVEYDYAGQQYVLVVFQRFGGRSYKTLPTVERFLRCLSSGQQVCS